jgi:ABC-2 type transport system permease protein
VIADLWTVMWKEWREMLRQYSAKASAWWSPAFSLAFFGVVVPLQAGAEWVSTGVGVGMWIFTPVVLLLQLMPDTLAGERERHTLETLLATRLPDAAILLGKVAAPLLWSWAWSQAVIVVALIAVNAVYGRGTLLLFPPALVPVGLGLGLLVGGTMAAVGALISLRSATVRQARQTLGLGFMALCFAPALLARIAQALLPGDEPPAAVLQAAEALAAADVALLAAIAAGVLLLLDAGLLALALARFRRSRLILD